MGRGGTVAAVLAGHRDGATVDFTKTYLDAPEGYETPVDYVGQVSADGLTITGVWSLLDADGTFEMHRDPGEAAGTEVEAFEEIPRR